MTIDDRPLRTFVAVLLDDLTREALGRLGRDLRREIRGVRWVEPSRLHLTLRFLGDVDRSRLDDVGKAIKLATVGVPPFDMELQTLGTFPPDVRKAHVVWAGIGDGSDQLRTIAGRLERELELLGFPQADRPFSPHLTLGRIRDRLDPTSCRDLTGRLERTAGTIFGRLVVDSVALVASDLRPTGPVYSVIGSAALDAGRQGAA